MGHFKRDCPLKGVILESGLGGRPTSIPAERTRVALDLEVSQEDAGRSGDR